MTEKQSHKTKQTLYHRLILRGIKLLNAILMTLPFVILWYGYLASRLDAPFYRRGNHAVVLIYLVVFIYYGKVNSAFMVSYRKVAEMVYNLMVTAVMTNAVIFVITWLLRKHLPNIGIFCLILIAQLIIAFLWSVLARWWYFATSKPERTAIVWDMRIGLESLIQSYGLKHKYNVVLTPNAQECVEDLDMLNDVDTVFLIGVHSTERNQIIKHCVRKHLVAFIIPRIGDTLMSSAVPMHIFNLPFLRLERYNPSPIYLLVKRIADILVSLIGLIILSPLMLVTAIVIRAHDHGPAFYRQTRLTRNGKRFELIKFRSMRVDAEKDGVARLSTKDDNRITPFGQFIRSTRIDEIPQLINILKGEMSIVGPRPERPEIHEEYCKELPDFDLRLQAKAGLTGYAQIYGKYNTTPYDKLQMDLMYMAHPSIVQDINLVFTTIKIMFMPSSTEGINQGETIAGEQDENKK